MGNIKVNAGEWNALTPDQRNQILGILQTTQVLGKEDRVVPDAETAAVGMSVELGGVPGWLCKLGCNAAEAAAVAACATLPPPANAVCVTAAHAAGKYCRSKC